MKHKTILRPGVLLAVGLFAVQLIAASGGAGVLQVKLRQNADGTSTVLFQGGAGGSYGIESSDNLESWTVVAESVVAQADWTEWNDTRLPAQAQRFYRVTGATGIARTVMRPVDPNTDSERLLTALAAGDTATAINLLRANGVSETALATVSKNLGKKPVRVTLAETFFRGSTSVPLTGLGDEAKARLAAADALGYGRRFWVAKNLAGDWSALYDQHRALFTTPPVGVFDFALGDTNLITFFKWYDRYAEGLDSVVVNWTHLSNHTETDGYTNVNRTLSGLYQLIKARKPDAFVWAGVVKKDDRTDVPWLQAFTFKPDGLLIWNLRQFHSPFAETRTRYLPVVGADMPMVVAGFYGYKPALVQTGEKLKAAKLLTDAGQRTNAIVEAENKLGEVGKISRDLIAKQEAKLQALGYRGMTTHGLLLESVTQANKGK